MRLPLRLAMWSGPRNISTALMRSWGNRNDTIVCDEPLYAYYLQQTDADHPGREEVIREHETDLSKIIRYLIGPIEKGKAIFYQKHMAHHLIDGIDREWLPRLTNCFLIRDPEEMLTSLARILPQPTVTDTGLPQQVELFQQLQQSGSTPPVLDARDVLENPRGILSELCRRLDVPFQETMLSWPPGRRPTDGVWGRYWYSQVEASTGFRAYSPKQERVAPSLRTVLRECQRLYEVLASNRLRVAS